MIIRAKTYRSRSKPAQIFVSLFAAPGSPKIPCTAETLPGDVFVARSSPASSPEQEQRMEVGNVVHGFLARVSSPLQLFHYWSKRVQYQPGQGVMIIYRPA